MLSARRWAAYTPSAVTSAVHDVGASAASDASDASGAALLKKDGAGYGEGASCASGGAGAGYHGAAGGQSGLGEAGGRGEARAGGEGGEAAAAHARKPLAFLSSAPSAFGSMFKRASKGDADSMKTDFLQV